MTPRSAAPPRLQAPRLSRSTTAVGRARIAGRLSVSSPAALQRSRLNARGFADMALLHVRTIVNAEPAEYLCEADESLLAALRDRLGLTGTKEGCATGDCGACSIVMNGRLVPSCLVLAAEAQDADILTIEGVANGESLHPLQQRFLEHAALQCGICTPGFIVAAKALLDRNPTPTESDVRYALAGNLCRCTGYDKIIRAVLDSAAGMRVMPR
jgi:carbon-monoxide dehydrogenase small subunit